jgi:hypothetical protein
MVIYLIDMVILVIPPGLIAPMTHSLTHVAARRTP